MVTIGLTFITFIKIFHSPTPYISSTNSSTIVRFSDEKDIAMSVKRFPESAYFPA